MKVKTFMNYNHEEHPGQCDFSPSLTVPDMSYTIRELLERFTAGTMPPIARQSYYEESPDIDNPDPLDNGNFDLVDAMELRDEMRQMYLRRNGSNKRSTDVISESEARTDDESA